MRQDGAMSDPGAGGFQRRLIQAGAAFEAAKLAHETAKSAESDD